MAIHFSDIGFALDEYDFIDELTAFVEDNKENTKVIEVQGKTCLCITVDGCAELWFPVVEGEIRYEGVQPNYRSGLRFTAKQPVWVDFDENGITGMLKAMHGDAYPVNLNIPFTAALPELGQGTELSLESACFAEQLDLYEDEADFLENCVYGEGLPVRNVIPTGCFAAFGNDDVAETPRAMLTGVITAAERLTNSYTELDYWKLTVEAPDGELVLLAAEELLYDDPVPGNVVMGKVWFSGMV